MATLHDIKLRAQALRAKIETNSITAEEVGQLFIDLAEVAQLTERDGAILGIRKVYPSVDALQADASTPIGADGKPLRKGNLVVVYNKDTERTDPNTGMVYIFRGDAWEMAGRLGNFDLVEIISQQLQGETTARTDGDNALRALITTLRADATKASQDLQAGIDTEKGRITELERQLQLSVTKRIEDDANLLLKIQAEATARTEGLASVDNRLGDVDMEHFGNVQAQLHAHRAGIEHNDRSIKAETTARTEAIADVERKAKEYADKAGKIKVVKRNGVPLPISQSGEVDIVIEGNGIDQDAVGAIVDAKIANLKSPTYNADTEEVEGGTQVTLSTEEGHEVTQFVVKGGGGGVDTATARILLSLSTDNRIVQKGSRLVVRYTYTHQNTDGSDTGVVANVALSVQQGLKSPIVTTATLQPSAKVYEMDLSDLTKETGTITVRLQAMAEDGLKKNVALSIEVRELSLRLQSTDFLVTTTAWTTNGTLSVPYYISGSGTKQVTLLVNGKDYIRDNGIATTGTTVRSLSIPTSLLVEGHNTVQMQAEADGLKSECIYFDLLYNPNGAIKSFIGLYIPNTGTDIVTATHLTPTFAVGQYEYFGVQFYSFGVNAIALQPDGNTFIASSILQTYAKRYKVSGTYDLTLSGDGAVRTFSIIVDASKLGVDASEVGVVLDLDADGRSNAEQGNDKWESHGHTTRFEDVDFVSSGWESGALTLRSGSRAIVDYTPFASEPITKGWTLEAEIKTDSVLDDDQPVLSCLDAGRGFAIYPTKAVLLTGTETTIDTEAGRITTKGGIEMPLSTSEYTRIAFVLHTKEAYRLMELYTDGTRIASAIYEPTGTFVQDTPQPLTISSSDANVSIRAIKAYERALTDDELLNSYIVSRTIQAEMESIKERNDVLNAQGEYEAPRTAKRGRLFVKRNGGLAKVFLSVNKKEDFLCEEVRYESPFGKEYDFVAKNIYIRIQGTSSTKYPWKNIRLYLNKGDNPQLWVNGVLKTGTSGDAKADAKKNKYAMSPTAKPVSVFTCKCDYSDSSMTHNTGFARLYHDLCRKLDLKIPPQETDPHTRASIEGYPCDIYNQDADGRITYYGQYNFNNDKSKSEAVFGMSNINPEAGACSLEFLNNTQPLCLFKTQDETDASFGSFDDALEFNIPEDVTWATATEGQRTAIKRLWGFIGRCARRCGANVNDNEQAYNDISHFNSSEFKAHAHEYFDVDRMLMWYLLTNYLALVDQRAKNMILRTWDGLKWYFTYYDGDTALGERNDSFLAYLYDVERNTFDLSVGKYAFEGHSSWLWCLVLGSFGDELRAMAIRLRKEMTNEAVFKILDEEQMGAWSERAYNKSGTLKYIQPATIGVASTDNNGATTRTISNYIYALQGNRKAHRKQFITRRFAYLDAMYLTDAYRSDNIDAYISRTADQAPSIVAVTASQRYRFGYGTNNRPLLATTSSINKGEAVDIAISGAFTVNDPIRIYGASAIRILDLTRINPSGRGDYPLQNTLVLSKCTALREIRAGLTSPLSTANFVIGLSGVTTLERVDVRGIAGVSIGQRGAFDLSAQRRLRYLDARDTQAKAVTLPEGAPLTEVYLPDTLTTLRLRSLPSLTTDGLHFDGWANITSLNFANCPRLNWRAMLTKCTALRYIRIEGVHLSGDGTELDDWAKYGGLTANGSTTSQARITGVYKLTKYRDDIAELRVALPELSIEQAPYTGIEWDDSTNNEDNITNLDNGTGFRGTDGYVVSGHIKELLHRRDRVLTKYDADTQTLLFTRLLKDNANYYADGQPAKLDGTQGDIMVYEPERWIKGVNDHYGLKKYGYWSLDAPAPPNSRKVLPIEMTTLNNIKLLYGDTLSEASSTNTYYTTYIAPIDGAVGVRWPSAFGIEVFAYFLDAKGTIVARHASIGQINGMEHGLYLFKARPEGAVKIAFCVPSSITPEYVLLTESLDPFEFEPDWVYEPAYMLGATLCIEGLNGLRCVAHGTGRFANYNMDQAMSMARGLGAGYGLMDYDRWRSVVLLWMATVGSRIATGGNLNASSLSASFAHPLDRIFFSKADNANQTYYSEGGVEAVVNAYHLLGYDCWIGINPVWLDGVIQRYGYNLNGNRSSYNLSGRETIQVSTTPWKITNAQMSTKYILHGRYMDVLSVMTGSPSKSNYWSGRGQDANNVNFKYFFVNRYWNINNITGMDVGSSTSLSAIRLQYTGKMRELSNQEYRALWT